VKARNATQLSNFGSWDGEVDRQNEHDESEQDQVDHADLGKEGHSHPGDDRQIDRDDDGRPCAAQGEGDDLKRQGAGAVSPSMPRWSLTEEWMWRHSTVVEGTIVELIYDRDPAALILTCARASNRRDINLNSMSAFPSLHALPERLTVAHRGHDPMRAAPLGRYLRSS
jgi:hypothetical protein